MFSLTVSYPVVLRSPGSASNSWMYAIAIETSLLAESDRPYDRARSERKRTHARDSLVTVAATRHG